MLTGLLLIVFVEPPTRWWTGGDVLSRDRRPAFLALSLAIAFVALLAIPGFRTAFELQTLDWIDGVLIASATVVWLIAARFTWRRRLLEKFFSVG